MLLKKVGAQIIADDLETIASDIVPTLMTIGIVAKDNFFFFFFNIDLPL